MLDPLQIFRKNGQSSYVSEKSIIRPTFSYLGNFTISDNVFRQIIENLAEKTDFIHKILKIRVENLPEGPSIYMEVVVLFGFDIIKGLTNFKNKAKKEIERLTTMNVQKINVVAKGIKILDNEK